MASSLSLCFHSLFSISKPVKRPNSRFFPPLRAGVGKVKIQQANLESSAVLRRPVVSPVEEKAAVVEEYEEVVVDEDERHEGEDEEGEEERETNDRVKGQMTPDWVVWEDTILEDTVPLVGFVRMILHSGKYENGDKLSLEHESAILDRLLPYHPEYEKKIGCGVDYIKVGLHPEYGSSRCLFIVRKDGVVVDFSFWKCIKGLIRTKYPYFAENFISRHFSTKREPRRQ